MTRKADEIFFLVFNSSWTGVFVKLKPPLKVSRSATALHVQELTISVVVSYS